MKVHEKHALPLRFVHWLNVPFLGLMIWSGWLIYWANDIYTPVFFPQWFYEFFNIPQRLAEGLSIHFFIAWPFIINGSIYLIWFLSTKHWQRTQKQYNAIQRMAYVGVIGLAILAVLSGFAIYKPVQLSWLAACFGGYNGARLVHFVVMITFCLFIFVHIVQVIRAGWNNFRAMVAGFEVERE